MADERLRTLLAAAMAELKARGTVKGMEQVIVGVDPPAGDLGPRCRIAGQGERRFMRMNSNSYLGLSLHPAVIAAEEAAARMYGAGPGAVRFIGGTFGSHVELEERLARFHGREAAIIFSAAYAAVMGVLPQFVTEETLVVSDALNHNSIINAIRLARPARKAIYRHNDMANLENVLRNNAGKVKRVLVVSDGVFSMRGDHAPLREMEEVCASFRSRFEEGIITMVDDSHGVGVFGAKGRGTEEFTGTRVDILLGTLGKAFGVNGGYVVGEAELIDYLRETVPFYVYSNPITPSEAAAGVAAVDIVDGPEGRELLARVRGSTAHLERGILDAGFETIPGPHPIVPLVVRDTEKTTRLVEHLFAGGILATGIKYPVVPKGDEEIRFQVSAAHTDRDLDAVLDCLKGFR